MIFFVANDGTIVKSVPSPVYQGSAGANDIYLIAPFAVNLQVTVAFKLPNGVWTKRYLMTPLAEIESVINEKTGKPYSGWKFSLPNEITQYYGTVTVQFFFYTGSTEQVSVQTSTYGVITATSSTSFTVGKGVPEILPDKPTEDIYNQILDNLSALLGQVNNGAFAARAIYAWNPIYIYGANEITFYPEKGEFGVFIKSLVIDNTQPPYNDDGTLNSESWQEIVSFDHIADRYFTELKDLAKAAASSEKKAQSAADATEQAKQEASRQATNSAESASIAKAAAQSAEKASEAAKQTADEMSDMLISSVQDLVDTAKTAANNAEVAEAGANRAKEETERLKNVAAASELAAQKWAEIAKQFAQFGIKINTEYSKVTELPPTGNPQYIYLIPNGSSGNNSYDEYIWVENKADYEKIGTTEVDLTDYLTKKNAAETYATIEKVETLVGDLDSAKADKNGNYPDMIVGNSAKAINDGKGRNIADITNKTLYNLGAFDTYVSNGNGTATVTRQTGYLYFDGNETWVARATNTPNIYRMVAYSLATDITSEQTASNKKYVANNALSTADGTYGAFGNYVTGIAIGATGDISYYSEEFNTTESVSAFKEWLAQNPIYLQYKTNTPYTETVIENQPVHTANQEEEQYWREEYKKGLNLFNPPNCEYTQWGVAVTINDGVSTVTGTTTVNNVGVAFNDHFIALSAGIYAVYAEVSGSGVSDTYVLYKPDGSILKTCQVSQHTLLALTEDTTFRVRFSLKGPDVAVNAILKCSITRGANFYPYKDYYGKLIRGKDFNDLEEKALYNKAFYDTVKDNIDGSATIKKKTRSFHLTTDYLYNKGWDGTSGQPGMAWRDLRIPGTNTVLNTNKFVCNFLKIDGDAGWKSTKACLSQSGTRIRIYADSVLYPTAESFILANPNIYIQYELPEELQYEEQVVKGQPIDILPQAGKWWEYEEWRKGLNLLVINEGYSYNANGIAITRVTETEFKANGTPTSNVDIYLSGNGNLRNLDVKKPYTFTVNETVDNQNLITYFSIIDEDGQHFANGHYDPSKYKNVTSIAPFLRFKANQSFSNASVRIMFVEGNHSYPYEPYYGGIVREKELNNVYNRILSGLRYKHNITISYLSGGDFRSITLTIDTSEKTKFNTVAEIGKLLRSLGFTNTDSLYNASGCAYGAKYTDIISGLFATDSGLTYYGVGVSGIVNFLPVEYDASYSTVKDIVIDKANGTLAIVDELRTLESNQPIVVKEISDNENNNN